MTRPSTLLDVEKQSIAYRYEAKAATITELAIQYKCHPRTIYRALEEHNVSLHSGHRQTKAQKVMALLDKYCITPDQLESVLLQATTFNSRAVAKASTTAALFKQPPATVTNQQAQAQAGF
jgi:transposase-like protein